MFQDAMADWQPPIDAADFREQVVQQYAAECDEVTLRSCIGALVDDVWSVALVDGEPVRREVGSSLDPSYRENQRQAVVDILHGLYVDDCRVATLSAPTGAGKSLILHGAMKAVDHLMGRDSFFSTPLNALIDQVDNDPFIAPDVVTLKGMNNYNCVHRQDKGTSVDKAVCQRVDNFECQHKETPHTSGGCPYYGRKVVAQQTAEVVTNLSYLMANSMIPEAVDSKLEAREILTIDECQSIEDFALQFISVNVTKKSVPVVWDLIERPPNTDDVDTLVEWLSTDVLPPVRRKLEEYDAQPELTEEESDKQDKLQQFSRKVDNLLRDVENNHWVANCDDDDDEWSVEFEPIHIGRFLDKFLWSQGNRIVLSSATIPKSGFLDDIGLSDEDVTEVEVESTFDPERRGVYTDETVGKMSMGERDRTIPKMARKIGDLADHFEGKRGFVHCHSYGIAKRLYDALPRDVQTRTHRQDPDNREASLESWLAADVDERGYSEDQGGQIFLSVAMDEGISLDDDATRWQVIAKAAYPYLGPEAKRANYRLNELDDWNWYAGRAAINLQQAVGRGMRSRDDWCHTYVLDTSAAQLIERNEHLFEDWFLNAVDVSKEQFE